MTATIRELRKALFNTDFRLITKGTSFPNSQGRRFLYEIEDQDLKVEFFIENEAFVVTSKIQ